MTFTNSNYNLKKTVCKYVFIVLHWWFIDTLTPIHEGTLTNEAL